MHEPHDFVQNDEGGRCLHQPCERASAPLDAIDWGVYGVPETFIVKGDGTIAYKLVGPMDGESFRSIVLPQIAAASR